MRVLAIDTALANCAAAVLDDSMAPICLASSEAEIGRGHAEQIMTMISDVMADSSTAFVDLDRVIVTTGPGSFTGLRVGLSVARGFGLVLGKPVVGVTTLLALARCVAPRAEGYPLLVALDGKKDEVYCQFFSRTGLPSGPPEVRTISSLASSLSSDIRLAGSAAARIADHCGLDQERVLSAKPYPPIFDVAVVGMETDPETAAPVPLYLRPPDAKPASGAGILRQ